MTQAKRKTSPPPATGDTAAKEHLFWTLAETLMNDQAVTSSTMMGFPCLRRNGKFFASLERESNNLIVKLPRDRVAQLIEDGEGVVFAPNGRVFREWAAIPSPDEKAWRALLSEAEAFASND